MRWKHYSFELVYGKITTRLKYVFKMNDVFGSDASFFLISLLSNIMLWLDGLRAGISLCSFKKYLKFLLAFDNAYLQTAAKLDQCGLFLFGKKKFVETKF